MEFEPKRHATLDDGSGGFNGGVSLPIEKSVCRTILYEQMSYMNCFLTFERSVTKVGLNVSWLKHVTLISHFFYPTRHDNEKIPPAYRLIIIAFFVKRADKRRC